jgi:hypothetical protein
MEPFCVFTGHPMAHTTIREITINADERAIINVCNSQYVKLVFGSCIIGVREYDGVVYTFTEKNPDRCEEEVDPIAEAAKTDGYYTDAESVVGMHNPSVTVRSMPSHCTDLDKYLKDLEGSSGDEYEKEDIPDSEEDDGDSVACLLDYNTDSSAALSYHYGDTQDMM